jgi:hypothetical protein
MRRLVGGVIPNTPDSSVGVGGDARSMVTLVKPVQLENALLPILITLLGMVMLVKFLQPKKASFGIVFPPVIITVLSDAGINEF